VLQPSMRGIKQRRRGCKWPWLLQIMCLLPGPQRQVGYV